MKNSETAQILEEGEATDFSLIDVSASDDDFLLASSSDFSTLANPDDIQSQGVHNNQPSNSFKVQPPKKIGKCNLRKSLAWDSAFFTSAGVLDAEELSSIIEGAETSVKQKHFLPGIEEDLSKSYDSASTFESDSLTLDSLEANLFCDIRASIQRTSRPSAQGNCSSTIKQGKTGPSAGCVTKPVEISPSNVVRPKLASKKPNPSLQQGASRILKPGSISKQVAKPAVRSKESKLLSRPPEAAAKPNSIGATAKPSLIGAAATKRTQFGTGRAKLECNIVGNTKGNVASLSKVPCPANSRNTVPKTVVSSKISSGALALGRAAPMRSSRSSCDSSSSCSSETTRKSQCDVNNRRKMDRNINLPSGSKIRAPSRVVAKSKGRSGDSNLSDYLTAAPKLSSSMSPTSSMSEWSTESSCSTTTVIQMPITFTPCPSSHSQNQYFSDDASSIHENQLAGWLDQSVKQPSTACNVSISRAVSAKPSGLRLPSAKIGYFDGGKAAPKTPSGNSRSRSAVPSNLSRSGALNGSPSKTANKPKTVVIPEPRNNINFKPFDLEDHPTYLPKTSNENVTDTSSKISKNISFDPFLEDNDNVNVINGGKLVTDSSTDTAHESVLVVAQKEASPGKKLSLSSNQATVSAEDVHNIMHITDGTKEVSDLPKTSNANVTGTPSKISKSISFDPAIEDNNVIIEGEHVADSSRETAQEVILVTAQKEASSGEKLSLLSNQATVSAEDVHNTMHTTAGTKELHDLPKTSSANVTGTSSKTSKSISFDLAQEDDNVINGGEHVADSSSETAQEGILVTAQKEASPGEKLSLSSNQATISAEYVHNTMHTTDGTKELRDLPKTSNANVTGTSSKISKSISFDPAQEDDSVINGGKHVADSSTETAQEDVNAKKEASPEEKLHLTSKHATIPSDVHNIIHATDGTKELKDLRNTSNANATVTSSEISKNISLDFAVEDDDKVFNGGKHVSHSSSETAQEVNLVVSQEEASPGEKLHLSSNLATICADDVHNIIHITDGTKVLSANPSSKEGQSNGKESSGLDSVCPSKDDSVHACKDLAGCVGNGTTNEIHDSGSRPIVAKQNIHGEKQVDDGFGMEATINEMEMQSKSNGEFQSQSPIIGDNSLSIISHPEPLFCSEKSTQKQSRIEKSAQSANLSTSSLSVLCSEATTETRTPFALKNSVASLIEVFNSSAEPSVDRLLKFDTLPSPEEGQKENC